MALFTFSGGVHPADGKEFAKNSPITEYLPKGDVVLPLGQHIGAPAQPIVSKGDQGVSRPEGGRSWRICIREYFQLCFRNCKGDRAKNDSSRSKS